MDLIKLPPLIGDTWLNSPPLNPHALKGSICLVYFWHYADSKAQNEIAELKNLWVKYNQFGLNIIGIHSPEFQFENKINNLEKFLNEQRIYWPIVVDNNYENWDTFKNKYWLSKFLSDKDGRMIIQNPGMGHFATIERRMQEILQMSFPIETENDKKTNWRRELQGQDNNQLSKQDGYLPNCIKDFKLPSPEIYLPNQIYLKGKFLASPDHFESIDENSELIVQVNASHLNLVLEAISDRCILEIEFEGKPLENLLSGPDTNNGLCVVKFPSNYQIFAAKHPVVGKLKIKIKEGAYKLFALEVEN